MNEQIFAACIIAASNLDPDARTAKPRWIVLGALDLYNEAIAVMRENAQQANAL